MENKWIVHEMTEKQFGLGWIAEKKVIAFGEVEKNCILALQIEKGWSQKK